MPTLGRFPKTPSSSSLTSTSTRTNSIFEDCHLKRGHQALIGDHSLLSYIWYPWQWLNQATPFRFEKTGSGSAASQILQYLKDHPHQQAWIASDSGGPYKKMRGSLFKFAVEAKRPLVALRFDIDRYITVKQHKIPVPGARITPRCSRVLKYDELVAKDPTEALRMIQRLW